MKSDGMIMGSLSEYARQVYTLLGSDRYKLPILVLLFMASSLFDILGIGLVGPYISLIIGGAQSFSGLIEFLHNLGFSVEHQTLLNQIGVTLFSVFFIKIIMIYLVNKTIYNFSYQKSLKMRSEVLARYQRMPYEDYILNNTSSYIYSTISLTAIFAESTLQNILRLTSELIVVIAISVLLIAKIGAPLIFWGAITVALFAFYNKIFRSRLYASGRTIDVSSAEVIKNVSEAMQGLKDIRILNKESYFQNKVLVSSKKAMDARITYLLISSMPKYVMEFVLISCTVITFLVSSILNINQIELASLFGMMGIAALRLLPSFNTIQGCLNQITQNTNAVGKLYADLNTEIQNSDLAPHETSNNSSFQKIICESLEFTYKGANIQTLKNVNLEVSKGECIGLIGPSGSGKSTIVNILLGFLKPQSGEIKIVTSDGICNQSYLSKYIAYVPQQIFLTDDTLKRNIALGVDDNQINTSKINESIHKCNLTNLVNNLPLGVDTVVGEAGITLSGGQRQRVAIARAFYFDRDVLVFDEATSSLDGETESVIVEEIQRLKGQKTLIIVAHRLTTLKYCNRIYNLIDGRIEKVESYNDLISSIALKNN